MISKTVTTRETLPEFPAVSVTVYVSVYKPGDWKLETGSWTDGTDVSIIFAAKSPSVSSVAVAPGSVKASPTFICIAASPTSVTTGGSMSLTAGAVVSVPELAVCSSLLAVLLPPESCELSAVS